MHYDLLFAAALPTRKSKYHKTEDASDSAGDESSDQLFIHQPVAPKQVKKSAPKSRKSEPVKLAARDDEYDEDEGRLESRYVLLYFNGSESTRLPGFRVGRCDMVIFGLPADSSQAIPSSCRVRDQEEETSSQSSYGVHGQIRGQDQ